MLRRRSSLSKKVGPSRRASIKNTLAADGVINDAADTAADEDLLRRTTNPLFNDGSGGGAEEGGAESKEESVRVLMASTICVFRLCSLCSLASLHVTPALVSRTVHVHTVVVITASPGNIHAATLMFLVFQHGSLSIGDGGDSDLSSWGLGLQRQ